MVGAKLTPINTRQIINALEEDKITHEIRGFKTRDFYGDNEFNIQALRDYFFPSKIHVYSKDEHVVFNDK